MSLVACRSACPGGRVTGSLASGPGRRCMHGGTVAMRWHNLGVQHCSISARLSAPHRLIRIGFTSHPRHPIRTDQRTYFCLLLLLFLQPATGPQAARVRHSLVPRDHLIVGSQPAGRIGHPAPQKTAENRNPSWRRFTTRRVSSRVSMVVYYCSTSSVPPGRERARACASPTCTKDTGVVGPKRAIRAKQR